MRRNFRKSLLTLIGASLLGACFGNSQASLTSTSASPSRRLEVARETLIQYFNDLATGNYAAAADRYGGEIELLSDWNADIDSADIPALFEAACTRQLQCLPVHSIVYATQEADLIFHFRLQFTNPDGSVFELGPCCGATEAEMPPLSEFECTVEYTNKGEYQVMCLPVYIP